MAFTNELIPDADKARIDWSKFKAWPFSKPLRASWWTIDREKNVFFVMLEGRGPDGIRPETYGLYWNGDFIRVEANVSGQGSGKFWEEIFWELLAVDIPVQLSGKKDEIMNDLKTAIDAHGRLFDRSHIKSVNIEIA